MRYGLRVLLALIMFATVLIATHYYPEAGSEVDLVYCTQTP